MTTEELKAAMRAQAPVVCNGIEYARVSAIIFRAAAQGVVVQAELIDRNNNSVTIVRPDRVELVALKGGSDK